MGELDKELSENVHSTAKKQVRDISLYVDMVFVKQLFYNDLMVVSNYILLKQLLIREATFENLF
jgi:hypothetical protein